jgi:hypothetical protein
MKMKRGGGGKGETMGKLKKPPTGEEKGLKFPHRGKGAMEIGRVRFDLSPGREGMGPLFEKGEKCNFNGNKTKEEMKCWRRGWRK